MDVLELERDLADRFRAARRKRETLTDSMLEQSRLDRTNGATRSAVDSLRHGGSKVKLGARAKQVVRVSTGELVTPYTAAREHTELTRDLVGRVYGDNIVYGYGSVFDYGYVMYDWLGPYIEIMDRGAFDSSLARADLQVSFLSSHEGLGMATTRGGSMAVGADDFGLGFAASMDMNDTLSRDIRNKIISQRTPPETSISGYVEGYEWDDDYEVITITEWNLQRGEISIVRAGANPAGWISAAALDNEDASASDMLKLLSYTVPAGTPRN